MKIQTAIDEYLSDVQQSRSRHTHRSYRAGMKKFSRVLRHHEIDPENASIDELLEDAITWLLDDLNNLAPATEQLYLTAVIRFYRFLVAKDYAPDLNLPRLQMLREQRARRPGKRLPQFPRDEIEQVLNYTQELRGYQIEDPDERLRILRDCAFLLTLADTGMRVHEICNLRRGDIDWNEQRAVVVGKGNRQDVIRFSPRSISAIRTYLKARSRLDGATGRQMTSLAVFARHDRGAGDRIEPISTTTGRQIVQDRVIQALGKQSDITPHSFRHYFVTAVLRGSGNLKLAQELARHQSISITQRYAHLSDDELDRGYHEIFNA